MFIPTVTWKYMSSLSDSLFTTKLDVLRLHLRLLEPINLYSMRSRLLATH